MVHFLHYLWGQLRGSSLFPHYYNYAKQHKTGKFMKIEEYIASDENINRYLQDLEQYIIDKKIFVIDDQERDSTQILEQIKTDYSMKEEF